MGGLIVLLIDTLQAGKEDKDFEWDRAPDDVEAKRNHSGPAFGTINPNLVWSIEEEVDDALIGEDDREDHTDRDAVSDIWKEEDGLENLLEPFDGIKGDGDKEGEDC